MTGEFDYDLVVIGGGPAGEKGAAQAAYFGKRVLLVEREEFPGGAAVHTGTLPSKTLRETAIFLSGYRQRELYGLSISMNRELAVPKLLSRKNQVRELEVSRIRWNLERHGVETMQGIGRLLDPHTVEIVCRTPAKAGAPKNRKVRARAILIATGSKPYQPSDIPFEDDAIDDSDTILVLDNLPKTMTILGAGVIGCEYASMFAAMQVKVTLVDAKPSLLPFLDAELGDRLRTALEHLGVEFRLGTSTVAGSVKRDDLAIRSQPSSGTAQDTTPKAAYPGDPAEERGCIAYTLSTGETCYTDKLLVCAGRSGRTEDLGLEALGIERDKRGYVKVNTNYQTAVPHIYAVGDVIGFPALASTSKEQGRIAACHAFQLDYRRPMSDLIPFGIYTIPEVSSVGMSEEAATAKGIAYVVGRAFFQDNARGKIIGDKEGMIKLLFSRDDRKLIGCHCIGDRASELVHIGQAVLTLGGTIDTFVEMVFNYPTLSESYKYAAYDALGRLGTRASSVP